MSSIVGNNTTPSWGYNTSGLNTDNQVASEYVMPGGGLITDVYCYFSGDGSAINAKLCIWDGGTGAVLWSSSTISVPAGTVGAGGQAWQHATVSPPLFVATGASIWIGWYRDPAKSAVFSVLSGGGCHWMTNTGATPSAFTGSGPVSTNGTSGTYADYTPSEAWVNTGTELSPVWTPGPVYINTGTFLVPVWTVASEIAVNTGTYLVPVWTPGS